MTGTTKTTALLQAALSAAVPLYIVEMRSWDWKRISETAQRCAQVVAEKGDIILYRSAVPGETAKAFNALARGIACLSFSPGGVTAFGLHFDAKFEPFGTRDPIPTAHIETLTKLQTRKAP